MKTCISCRYHYIPDAGPEFLRCKEPKMSFIYDPTGVKYSYCSVNRLSKSEYFCGLKGKFWEPIPPKKNLWQKIKQLILS